MLPATIRRIALLLAAVAAAALIAAGCGGTDGNGNGGGSGDDLAEEQELVLSMGELGGFTGFDPTIIADLYAVNVVNQVYAGMYRIEGDESELVPWLAEGEPEVSEDGLTYTVTLRDANWSDGEPITAEDVRRGVLHALNPDTGAYFAGFMTDIDGAAAYNAGEGDAEDVAVTAVDERTVEFKLAKVVPWFDYLMALNTFYPLRQETIDAADGDGVIDEDAVIASGPFMPVSWERDNEIVLERNDEFWGADDVELDRIVMRMIAEEASALREYEEDKLDTAFPGFIIPTAEVESLKSDDEFVSQATTSTQYLYMNTQSPDLQDVELRRAIAQAIDRRSIVDNVTQTGEEPLFTAAPDGIPGFDTWSEGTQEFLSEDGSADTGTAQSILDDAGIEDASLDLFYSSSSDEAQGTAEVIQSNLDEIGVTINLKPVADDVLFDEGVGFPPLKETTDLVLLGWIQDYPEAQDWYQLFYGPNIESGLNSSMYADSEYDALYEEAIATVDEDARHQLYRELEAKLVGPEGDFPIAPLFQDADATLVKPWVQGFELNPSLLLWLDKVSITDEKPGTASGGSDDEAEATDEDEAATEDEPDTEDEAATDEES